MDRDLSDLTMAWERLAGPSTSARAVGAALLRRWNEPHRRYHTPWHLRLMLDALDRISAVAIDISAVRFAAWFHDAVYDGVPGVDEERSAQLALQLLPRCGCDQWRAAEVARLVRATAEHRPDRGDLDGAALCDADLAILGSAPEVYARYATAVREEYRHVGEERYRTGRSRVLRSLLDRPTLYLTPLGRDLWEEHARRNVTAELAELSSTPST